MRRLYVVAAIAALSAGFLGCTRPSESDCKEAITNIRRLHGNESGDTDGFQAAVRSCQGSANRESVKCFINAQNLAELKECEGDLYEKMFGKDESAAPVTPAPAAPIAPTAPPDAATAPAPDTATAPAPDTATPPAPDTATPPAPDTAAPTPPAPETAAPTPAPATPTPAPGTPTPAPATP